MMEMGKGRIEYAGLSESIYLLMASFIMDLTAIWHLLRT